MLLNHVEKNSAGRTANMIAGGLQAQPGWKIIAFMATCCERMVPNFYRFHVETGFGDPSILRDALDKIWLWIRDGALPGNRADLISFCDGLAPDTEKFSSEFTSAALDAANALAITLEALVQPTSEKAEIVEELAVDTVDGFVQTRERLDPADPHFEGRISSSKLMRAELSAQSACVDWLLATDDRSAVVLLRGLQANYLNSDIHSSVCNH
ncbi:DUF416 family protein [Lysobacter sp. 22409]|uniref:DUF416 family protein n=1 Tax=Lysobacter sp. 22409 TaxID=3453917 RepID=UPI003F865109